MTAILHKPSVYTKVQPLMKAVFNTFFPETKLVLDPNYGLGVFWKWSTPFTILGGDIDLTKAKDIQLDCLALPFANKSVDVVVLDPPFLHRVNGKGSSMESRYAALDTKGKSSLLLGFYEEAMAEAARVARLGIIVKCQDGVESRVFRPIHIGVVGVSTLPLAGIAILARTTVGMQHPFWKKAEHLRNTHSYFLVFNQRG